MLCCFVLMRKCQESNLWTPSDLSHHPTTLVLLDPVPAVAGAGGCVLASRSPSHPQPCCLCSCSPIDTFQLSCSVTGLKGFWMFAVTQITSDYVSQGWVKACRWSDGAFGVNVKEALSPQKSLHCICTASLSNNWVLVHHWYSQAQC